jgi:hypothetical protein
VRPWPRGRGRRRQLRRWLQQRQPPRRWFHQRLSPPRAIRRPWWRSLMTPPRRLGAANGRTAPHLPPNLWRGC